MPWVNCNWCGKEKRITLCEFNHKYHFCNKSCRKKFYPGKLIKFNCEYCGKQKEILLSKYKYSKHHFCDMACRSKLDSLNKRGDKATNWKEGGIKGYCNCCGKEIKIERSRFNKGKHHFCNKSCYNKWIFSQSFLYKIKVNCDWCGKEIERWKYIRKLYRKSFCNKSCHGKFLHFSKTIDLKKRDMSSLYKGGISKIKFGVERDTRREIWQLIKGGLTKEQAERKLLKRDLGNVSDKYIDKLILDFRKGTMDKIFNQERRE